MSDVDLTERAVVLLSGGQDSTYCLAWAISRYLNVGAVSFNYGQRHSRELQCARDVAGFFGEHVAWHEVIDIGSLLHTPGCTLFPDNGAVPKADDWYNGETPSTYVPFRNAFLLLLAGKKAMEKGWADANVVIGVTTTDYEIHPYPDCSPSFVEAMQDLFMEMDTSLNVQTPLLYFSKAKQVQFSLTLPGCYEAWSLSHTAYSGCFPPDESDPAASLRAKGFEEAGLPDPLIMRAYWEGYLTDLPTKSNYSRYKDVKDLATLVRRVGAVGLDALKIK